MLIYIDLSVLSATRNYDLEGKDSHCVQICTQPDLKGFSNKIINTVGSQLTGIGEQGKLCTE